MADDRVTTYQHCEWQGGGFYCRYPGTISPIVYAGKDSHPGPWYCTEHFHSSNREDGLTVAQESLSYIPPAYQPGDRAPIVDAIARLIDERARAEVGDSVRAMTPAQCAVEVNRLAKRFGQVVREPGDDEGNDA
jgi:hypothetical protein